MVTTAGPWLRRPGFSSRSTAGIGGATPRHATPRLAGALTRPGLWEPLDMADYPFATVQAQRALDGAAAARERLDAALVNSHPSIPLLELLGWWYQLEEFLKNRIPDYYPTRERSTAGRVFGALVYARGRATHDLITPTRRPFGGYGSAAFGTQTYGGGGGPWQWVALCELGEPPRREQHHRDEWYAELVAGQRLILVVDAAGDWVAELQDGG